MNKKEIINKIRKEVLDIEEDKREKFLMKLLSKQNYFMLYFFYNEILELKKEEKCQKS